MAGRLIGPGHNTARFTLRSGDSVYFSMILWDYDTATFDDMWCAEDYGMDHLGGPRDAEHWAETDDDMNLPMDTVSYEADQGDCRLGLHIEGIEAIR